MTSFAGRKWFDCAECHNEKETHELLKMPEMAFACKKCKKTFRKDAREFEESYAFDPAKFILKDLTFLFQR
jgi:NAD-dependent SIR2 family protein deacetylase